MLEFPTIFLFYCSHNIHLFIFSFHLFSFLNIPIFLNYALCSLTNKMLQHIKREWHRPFSVVVTLVKCIAILTSETWEV